MDLQNINKVSTLEDYAKLTSNILAEEFSKRFQLNLVTIRTLKNLRSFELQYFNKVHSVGAASLILERILQSSWPASMLEDGTCANELVLLIRYWLECIRKHLTIEKPHWWKFLNILLDFIQKLPSHTTILTALVRHLGASVLELATRDEVPVETRHKILICFKCISAAPREVRTEYKDKFDRYFQELARYLCTCGDVCVQFVVVEALLRWVLPREQRAVRRDAAARWLPRALYSRDAVQDFVDRDWTCFRRFVVVEALLRWVLPREQRAVRRDAAARWLPRALYSRDAVQDFVDRDWKCFRRDTRDFLNIHNKSDNNVVSILCYKLRLESVNIKSSTRQRWLDINIGTKRLSVMLDRPMYQMLEISKEEESYLAALYITEDNTEMVKMARSLNKGTRTIQIKVIDPLQMFPTKFLEGKHLVTMTFTAEFDVNKVDNALRAIFDTKYTFVEETGNLTVSRQDSSTISEIITDVETRFSCHPQLLGRKPLGSKPPHASTASSSSVFDNAYEPRLNAESKLNENTTNNDAESEEHHSCSSLSQIVAQPLLDPSSCTSPNSKSTDRRKGKNFVDERNLSPELRVSVEKDTVIDLLDQEVFDQFHKRLVPTNRENTPREKDKSLSKERENLNQDRKIPMINKDIVVDQLSQEAFEYFSKNNTYNKMPKLSKTDLLPKKRRKTAKPVINENEQSSKVSDELIATPLIKRRRKLYSEIDNDLSKVGIRISETEEETRDSAFIVPENVQAKPKTAATPYTELEKIRKNKQLRTFFKRKSSPRKEEVFDQLKATVENTNIVLVDQKNVRKTDVFNFTSSSEAYEDFKDRKTVTRTDKKTQRARRKVSKRTRSKSKMQSEMVDERMRKADPCNLNTSIVQELSAEKKSVTEVEPIHNIPRVDMLHDCIDSDKETTPAKKSRKRKRRTNETNTKQDNRSSSGSSLPALEIETVKTFTKPEHTIINLDALNKNSYDNLHESNAQDVLEESDQVNDSMNNMKVKTAANRSQSTSSDIISHEELIVVLDKFDIHNEQSISTTGKSPIEAHGVHYESPPKIDDINKTISPRGFEAEGLSDKARMYYNQLLKDKDSSSEKHKCSELRRYSGGPHVGHQVTLSELPEANNTKTKDKSPSETSPRISRKPIKQPISLETSAKPQVKENADSLSSKLLTFEIVKENQPSTSQPRQDGSAEHKNVASNFDDWCQRNESAKSRPADIINDVIDTALHKIETWREIDHNTNLRLISLLVNVVSEQEKLNSELRQLLNDKFAELDVLVQRKEAFLAEFMIKSRDLFRRKNQDSAESFRQLVEEIQAFRPPPHDADDEGI